MKRIVEITETKRVEVEVPAFFKTSESCYYMTRENDRLTQIWLGSIEAHTSIEMRTLEGALSPDKTITEITMEEFYSKLNEAFNILSIGSHQVDTDAVLNNFSQADRDSSGELMDNDIQVTKVYELKS